MNGEFIAFFILSLFAIIGGVLMLNLTKVMHMMLGSRSDISQHCGFVLSFIS